MGSAPAPLLDTLILSPPLDLGHPQVRLLRSPTFWVFQTWPASMGLLSPRVLVPFLGQAYSHPLPSQVPGCVCSAQVTVLGSDGRERALCRAAQRVPLPMPGLHPRTPARLHCPGLGSCPRQQYAP